MPLYNDSYFPKIGDYIDRSNNLFAITYGYTNTEPRSDATYKKVALNTLTEVKKLAKVAQVQPEIKLENVQLLKELGFDLMHNKVQKIAEARTKENMAILAGYTKISHAEFDHANQELKRNTRHEFQLSVVEVKKYTGIPPREVLLEMQKAIKADLFTTFEIISIEKVPDPILVGRVEGSKDMFFIAEWGDDISLQEILES